MIILNKKIVDKTEIDKKFMKKALEMAQKAFDKSEVPIGAIVVNKSGKIIGRGYNLTEKLNSQIHHAEIISIKKASKKLNDWRLAGCTMYVTLEPCLMCLGLISISRISRIVYGAKSTLFGSDIDNLVLPDLYKKHMEEIVSGVMVNEALELLKKFFKKKRVKSE